MHQMTINTLTSDELDALVTTINELNYALKIADARIRVLQQAVVEAYKKEADDANA